MGRVDALVDLGGGPPPLSLWSKFKKKIRTTENQFLLLFTIL